MKVKINTKEKFYVITLEEPILSANMTEETNELLLSYLEYNIKNVVLKMELVKNLDEPAALTLRNIQQRFYEKNCSFVICELQKPVEEFLKKHKLLEVINVTPTESEAWDIVQMEEIEREMFDE